jgi:capsular polysaccharide biosynthesis protein
MGTWHYLRNSLHRDWRTWSSMSLAGALIGLGLVMLMPPASQGSVTVLMAHPANLEAQSAMSTDVSLLTTREVSARTVSRLHLDMTPEAFRATVTADPATTEVLTITVSAPTTADAVARAAALTSVYLDFRAEQLRSLSSGLVNGYQTRVAGMQKEVTQLNAQYAVASQEGGNQTHATELLTRRSQLNSQIYDMQQSIADAALTTDAAVSSTHVIDEARAVNGSLKRAAVLDVASGLIGGTALGVGFVLFRALTSTTVRRREDVAVAMNLPVRYSVASDSRLARRLWRGLGPRGRSRPSDLDVLVRGLEAHLDESAPTVGSQPLSTTGPTHGVALAAIGDPRIAAAVVDSLVDSVRAHGRVPFVVDLTAAGALARRRDGGRRASGAKGGAVSTGTMVFRPTGVPALAAGPAAVHGRAVDLPDDVPWREAWEGADVVLALVRVDPGIDAENLRTWVDRVVPLVTAGEASAELLETTAELIRAAGLVLPFAMLVGAARTDESFGAVALGEAARSLVGQQ